MKFDRIVHRDATGEQELTLEELMAVPLPTRVRWILREELSFFSGEEPVPTAEALKDLRLL